MSKYAHAGSPLGLQGDYILPVEDTDIYFPFYSHAVSGRGHEPSIDVSTIVPDDRFGQAIAVEEGTENLLPNPRLLGEGLPSSWLAGPQNENWEIENIQTKDNHNKIRLSTTNGRAYIYAKMKDVVIGRTYTFSMYIHDIEILGSGNNIVWIRSATGSHVEIIGVERGRISYTFTADNNNQDVRIGVGASGTTSGTIVFSQPQIEEKPYATSFTEGTRGNGSLVYPKELINRHNYTINMWAKTINIDKIRTLFEVTNTYGNWSRILFYFSGDNYNRFSLVHATENQRTNCNAHSAIPFDQWNMYTITFDSSTVIIYLNGEEVARNNNMVVPIFKSNATLNIGGRHFDRLNGHLSGFLIRPYATHPSEIKAWYDYGKHLYDPYDYYATFPSE